MAYQSRGLRNNNVGNLRHGDQWQGLSAEQTDKSFCQFDSMEYGIRALLKTMQTYHKKYGIDTIEMIVARWAPTNENDTESYINSVAKQTHLDRSKKLFLDKHPELYLKIAKAIAYHENGKEAKQIPAEIWQKGYELAFNAQ